MGVRMVGVRMVGWVGVRMSKAEWLCGVGVVMGVVLFLLGEHCSWFDLETVGGRRRGRGRGRGGEFEADEREDI